MTVISSKKSDFLSIYQGFGTTKAGLGKIDPNIYSTKAYRKKKINKILIGTLNRIIYSGFDHDKEPLVLVMAYEAKYNTIIGYNFHYLPENYKRAILDVVIRSNRARIKKNNPIIVDYSLLKKAVPKSVGAIRRYKVVGVRVVDQYKLDEWPKIVKEKSKWQNIYKDPKKAKSSAFSFLDKIFKRFRG